MPKKMYREQYGEYTFWCKGIKWRKIRKHNFVTAVGKKHAMTWVTEWFIGFISRP